MGEGYANDHPPESFSTGEGNQDQQQDVGIPIIRSMSQETAASAPPAQQRGGGSQQKGDYGADAGGDDPDLDAHGQAAEGPNEKIPAHPVGAERVAEGGWQVFSAKIRFHSGVPQQDAG